MNTSLSKNRLYLHIVRCISALLLFCCCSVKENRTGCPCRLVLDFGNERNAHLDSLVLVVASDGDVVHTDTILRSDFSNLYQVDVPRGRLTVTAVSMYEGGVLLRDGAVLIPYGTECPEIFMDCQSFDADFLETVTSEVIMRKNYCRMTIGVEDGENFSYGLNVKGEVDGYGSDGICSVGKFCADARKMQTGEFLVLIPRQYDASLLLDVNDGSDIVKTFALGEYILASGFDWTAPDLGDIVVGIDYARTVLSLSVIGWDKTYHFDFVI